MQNKKRLAITFIGFTIVIFGLAIYFGNGFDDVLPYLVSIGYLLFNYLNFRKYMLWTTKFTVYAGVALLTLLSRWKEIFPNGIDSPQLAVVVACIEVIDIWFEKS